MLREDMVKIKLSEIFGLESPDSWDEDGHFGETFDDDENGIIVLTKEMGC